MGKTVQILEGTDANLSLLEQALCTGVSMPRRRTWCLHPASPPTTLPGGLPFTCPDWPPQDSSEEYIIDSGSNSTKEMSNVLCQGCAIVELFIVSQGDVFVEEKVLCIYRFGLFVRENQPFVVQVIHSFIQQIFLEPRP